MTKKITAQIGFTLLEILFAWFFIASFALSLIDMQNYLLHQSYILYLKSKALDQAQSLLERLKANQTSTVRLTEIENWQQHNQLLLPKSHGSYTCNLQACTVTLQWYWQQQPYSITLTTTP